MPRSQSVASGEYPLTTIPTANGIVVIENSIARNNTSNGFKLGGEGQPVAHEIHNSVAVGNHLDGFADNISLRSHEGKYDDAISGHVDNSNYFIRDGRTENSEGNQLSVNDFQSLKLPMPLQRNADGSFQTDDFLTKQ